MSATVITFPTRERPKKPPAQKALSDRPADTAVGIVLPAEMTVDIDRRAYIAAIGRSRRPSTRFSSPRCGAAIQAWLAVSSRPCRGGRS